MKQATEQDLQSRTTALLNDVESGETVEVTRGGRVVALLVPAASTTSWPDFLSRLKKSYPAGPQGKPISEVVDEGRGERP
jgi:prevent-host-death family protein